MNNKFVRFNDGVAAIYKDKSERTSFGAKVNTTGLDGLEFIAKLDFKELSRRQQDQEFAEQNGFSLARKIQTRSFKGAKSKCKVVIDNMLYDISYVDKTKDSDFLYLEGVRELDS